MAITTRTPLDLVHEIRRKTAAANQNNITRTAAYLDYFLRHPEVEWALLAHLVSRNGGWEMTDLKGEWLSRILTPEEVSAYFAFLERNNWLIFHDAYAQLLLYEAMKESGEDYTSLFPQLGVSHFMVPYWQSFLIRRDTRRLTRALIVNEQQYIHQRVVQQPFYRRRVLETLTFQTQAVLSLDHVLFPFFDQDRRTVQLIGIVVHDFASVEQRVRIGKALYRMLTEDETRTGRILDWVRQVPHTGSRADFWPHFFTPNRLPASHQAYTERIRDGRLMKGQPKLYSPRLTDVWPDMEHPPADGADWFTDPKWHVYTEEDEQLPVIDGAVYLQSLERIDTLLAAREAVRMGK